MMCVGFFMISGLINFVMMMGIFKEFYGEMLLLYYMMFGVKFFVVMGIFFFVSVFLG